LFSFRDRFGNFCSLLLLLLLTYFCICSLMNKSCRCKCSLVQLWSQ
jgi:hypothetical protein